MRFFNENLFNKKIEINLNLKNENKDFLTRQNIS